MLVGVGAGAFIQASFSVAQAKVSRARASDAASFIALAQNLGIVLSLAIAGAVFQNRALDDLHRIIPNVPREVLRGAITGSGSALLKDAPEHVRDMALAAIVKAMSRVYYLVMIAGTITVLGSLFMKVSCSLVPCYFVIEIHANIIIAREDLCSGRCSRISVGHNVPGERVRGSLSPFKVSPALFRAMIQKTGFAGVGEERQLVLSCVCGLSCFIF